MTRSFTTADGHLIDEGTLDKIAAHVRVFDKTLTPEHKIAIATRHLADDLPRLRGELRSAVQTFTDFERREHWLSERRTHALEILALEALGEHDLARRSANAQLLIGRYRPTSSEEDQQVSE